MIPQCLGYVVENLIDVLRLIGCTLRTPVADAIDYAQRQTTLVRREWNTAEAQSRSQIGIGVRLKEGESASIEAEAKLIGQSWTEDMRLAADEVLRQVNVVFPAISAAVERIAKRKAILSDLVDIAVAHIRLVPRTDVPIQPLVPLNRIVVRGGVDDVIIDCLSAVRIRHRIKLQNILCDRINLTLAEDVVLTVARQLIGCAPSRIRLIELDALTVEVRTKQFGKIPLPNQRSGHAVSSRIAIGNTIGLDITKVEEPVLQNGETERSSELILVVWGNRQSVPVLRIQACVANILPDASVD